MYILTEFNTVSSLFRLILAAVLGGIIGLDREKITRSAGFRTYSLVCLGATLAMLIGHYINTNVGESYDISRIGAQVISGIGFIGAGAIINSGTNKVIGLTTAAALWTCACMGLAVGCGFYSGAIGTCFLTLVLLRVMKFVDRRAREKKHFVDIYIELADASFVNEVLYYLEMKEIKIVSSKTTPPKVRENQIGLDVTILVKNNQNSWDIMKALTKLETVKFAHKEYL
ncbi:MAG: MgtC/SapB family protein [Lachnospiraceae bacterium]